MLFWTIQVTIISIILIFLIHHLLVFFKTNLTTPKVKDLVNAPTQKYDAIFNAMNASANSTANSVNINNISLEELLPPIQPDPIDMKNELKQFMKKQFKENNNNPSNSTINLDTFNSSSSSTMQYSNY
jgi:hypothetical protein